MGPEFNSSFRDAFFVAVGSTDVEGDYTYLEWYNDGMDCYQYYGYGSATAPVQVLRVTWTTPGGVGQNGGGVPMSNGTPPQGSPAFINTTTMTATGSPSGGTYSWSTSS